MSGGHGGARANAGRKAKSPMLRKVGKTFSMEKYLVDWLGEMGGKQSNELVGNFLKGEYERKTGQSRPNSIR